MSMIMGRMRIRVSQLLLLAALLLLLLLGTSLAAATSSSSSSSTWTGRSSNSSVESLVSCLTSQGVTNITTQNQRSEFESLLYFSIQNLRYTESWVPRPAVIVLPATQAQVQSTVRCSAKLTWQVLIRSGGHSYEAQSSWSDVASSSFIIMDLMLLDRIHVDVAAETAWVEGGATLGNVYTAIANATSDLGFPAGTCPTVGVGGHISGGGYGMLTRKYGLAADNVLDALLVDAQGNILDRHSMGADVFWALRGGGGGSFGVVVAWKLRLVRVPPVITVFAIQRTGSHVVSRLMHKWQRVGYSTVDELQLRTETNVTSSSGGISATFYGQYLGNSTALVRLLNATFPELGLRQSECQEKKKFIDAVDYYAQEFIGRSRTDRYYTRKAYFKAKSEVVRRQMSVKAMEGFIKLLQRQAGASTLITPFGGAMAKIPSDASPFPYRKESMMIVHYSVAWPKRLSLQEEHKLLGYMRMLGTYLRRYAAKDKYAYVNYLDLDLGFARNGTASSVEQGKGWGEAYFGAGNYPRLVKAKSIIDPSNFFRSAQSIPPLAPASRP